MTKISTNRAVYYVQNNNYRMPLKSVQPIRHLRTTPGYLMGAEQSLDIAIFSKKGDVFSRIVSDISVNPWSFFSPWVLALTSLI